MYEQVYEPIAGNLALSTLVAIIPILALFVLLAGLRVAAQWASLVTLAVPLVIAVLVYEMPINLALNSTLLGICFGLFPIVWIVIVGHDLSIRTGILPRVDGSGYPSGCPGPRLRRKEVDHE